ncbi:MAG: glutathione S-transferase family protein [Alphaproteobacteria bacterium]|nr:glutathione S-transferase family protein [Alphaproteobacteria bacterium]
MITLWGRRNSANVQKVLWTLEELGVRFTREAVGGSFGGNRDADFLAMNPMGLVPVIRDGDVTMFESNAIVRYLTARYANGELRPTEHLHLAMAEQWMEWQQNVFAQPVLTIFMNSVRMAPEKRNAAAVAEAESKAVEALKIADAHLARHDWFAGSAFSFGDIVMGTFLYRYMGLDCTKPDMPHVREWLEAIEGREAFRNTIGAVPRAKDPADWLRIEKEFG